MIEVFKMFKGFDNIKLNDFFQVVKHKFERPYTQNLQTTGAFGCQEIFFTVRIIDVWNSLRISLINIMKQ